MKQFEQKDVDFLNQLINSQFTPPGALGILVDQLKEKVKEQEDLRTEEQNLLKQLAQVRSKQQVVLGSVDSLAESVLKLDGMFKDAPNNVDLTS